MRPIGYTSVVAASCIWFAFCCLISNTHYSLNRTLNIPTYLNITIEQDLDPDIQSNTKFHLDDTNDLIQLKEKIKAMPLLFGYSKQDGLKVFPPQKYPKCSELYPPAPNQSIKIDKEERMLYIQCPPGQNITYTIGPQKRGQFINPKYNSQYNIRQYNGPTPLHISAEFAFGSCDGQNYELADLKPIHNSLVHKQALEKRQMNIEKHNGRDDQLYIINLTLDSFSRRHFFRKLPETIKKLNQYANDPTLKVYDYKFHNVMGGGTSENQSYFFAEKFKGFGGKYVNKDKFGKKALYYQMSEKGFVTTLGFEACATRFNRIIGEKPAADHVAQAFFCVAKRFSGYSSHKDSVKNQRCIGDRMAHRYLMDYTTEVIDSYPDVHHWVYNHFTAAHEMTGQHAATLDDDIAWYLDYWVNLNNANRTVVIFLVGDHGMRYGDFKLGPEANQEHRLPMFYLIAPKHYIESMKADDILEHNSIRLTTKPDLRRSQLYLADFHLKNSQKLKHDNKWYNLFKDWVPNKRTCANAGISLWWCASMAP